MSIKEIIFNNQKFIEKFSGQHVNPTGLPCYQLRNDVYINENYEYIGINPLLKSDLYTNIHTDYQIISDETDVLIAGIVELPSPIIKDNKDVTGYEKVAEPFLITANSKYSKNRWVCCYKLSDVLDKNN